VAEKGLKGYGGSMLRGGSWNNNPRNVRAANRNKNDPTNRNNNNGFRLGASAQDIHENNTKVPYFVRTNRRTDSVMIVYSPISWLQNSRIQKRLDEFSSPWRKIHPATFSR